MTTDTTDTIIVQVPLSEICESPLNHRRAFRNLDELAASIQAEGRIHQALKARPAPEGSPPGAIYELVFGHRRFRAAPMAGLATVPLVVEQLTDAQVIAAQVAENLQREDPHPFEEAEAYAAKMKLDGISAEQLWPLVGKKRTYVYNRLRLLSACPQVRTACIEGEIGAEVALLLARLPSHKIQEQALKDIANRQGSSAIKDGGKRTYRAIRELLLDKYSLDLRKALFDREDPNLLAGVPDCLTCPKRSGNDAAFHDVAEGSVTQWGEQEEGDPDVCTDPTCFAAKKKEHLAREADKLREAGAMVVAGNKAAAAVDQYGKLKNGYLPLAEVKKALKAAGRAATAAPQVLSVQDPRTGKVLQAVRAADLQAAGVTPPEPEHGNARASSNYEAERKKRQELAATIQAQRDAIITRTLQVAAKKPRTILELRTVAHAVVSGLDYEATDDLFKRRGVTNGDEEELHTMVDQMPNGAQLGLFILELLLQEHAHVSEWSDNTDAPVFDALVQQYDVAADPAAPASKAKGKAGSKAGGAAGQGDEEAAGDRDTRTADMFESEGAQ